SNGVTLGSFQYIFLAKGLFLESYLTIWIHGTLEIPAIIIAGGAGIVL
ncbi:MAG: stage II sporulation protein M, partial [Flavobacteriales bacterium]|nr:stage II sporulation protein M [Flavobacteriales bacterium]